MGLYERYAKGEAKEHGRCGIVLEGALTLVTDLRGGHSVRVAAGLS